MKMEPGHPYYLVLRLYCLVMYTLVEFVMCYVIIPDVCQNMRSFIDIINILFSYYFLNILKLLFLRSNMNFALCINLLSEPMSCL